MAQNPSNVIPDQLIVVEGGKQLVPPPSSGDSGKVLGVLNSNGDIGWTEDREGMAQQQADWAETDSSKVTFIANKPSGQMAPASTSSDSGKVLKVDAQGAPVWGDAPAGTAEFLWSTVTLADVEGAISAGKSVVITDDTFSDDAVKCYLEDVQTSSLGTTYYFSSQTKPGSLSASNQNASVRTLMINMNGAKLRDDQAVGLKLVSEDSSVTIADGTYSGQLNITTNAVPASTSAEANKVLTVNSSGTPVWADAQGGGGGSSAVSGSYVVDADPAYVSVAPSTPTVVDSTHIYYELADSTETRQIAAIEIPEIILSFDSNWQQVSEIQQNLSTSWAQISLNKLNTSTGTCTFITGLTDRRFVQRSLSNSYPYFWLHIKHLLYVPSSPLPVLSENEKYVITVLSYVGNPSSYIYPTPISSYFTANVYFSSTSDKVVFSPCILPNVDAPLSADYDVLKLNVDPSKGFFVQTNDNQYNNTLSIRNEDVDKSLGYDPQNPEGYLRYVSLKNVENSYSDWSDQKIRFPAHRAYLESSDTMKANPSSSAISWKWQLNQGNRGNVYIVHFEIPMTSSGNADVNCICKFCLQDREEDWETRQQTMHYHYYTLFGQYIASEQIAVFDGAITVPETKGMPDNNYWSPTVTPLDSGTTLTLDDNRSPKYCWSFI